MVAVTYGVATPAGRKSAGKRKSFFTILFDAIVATQTKRAERELIRYRHLLPPGFTFGNKDQPFGG